MWNQFVVHIVRIERPHNNPARTYLCMLMCFELHGNFHALLQLILSKFLEIVDQPGLDVFGQVYNQWKNKECVCPNCSRSIAASRFAPHLEKCLGMGRNSSRIANRRYESKTSQRIALRYRCLFQSSSSLLH